MCVGNSAHLDNQAKNNSLVCTKAGEVTSWRWEGSFRVNKKDVTGFELPSILAVFSSVQQVWAYCSVWDNWFLGTLSNGHLMKRQTCECLCTLYCP